MLDKKERAKGRNSDEKLSDFYYRISGGLSAETQVHHIAAMWEALGRCVSAGICTLSAKENGVGTLWVYEFPKGEEPTFSTTSDDLFNQIELKVLENS